MLRKIITNFKSKWNKIIKVVYWLLTFSFIVASIWAYLIVFQPQIENPPKSPIIIGAGNIDNAIIDRTKVTFYIPSQTVEIEVTLNITQPDICFLYALLPFTVSNVSSYAIYNYYYYPLSVYSPKELERLQEIGTFGNHFINTPEGLAVLNASVHLETPVYRPTEITIGANVTINEDLLAIDDLSGGRKSVIYTFFGGNTKWTQEMADFRTPMCQLCLRAPFVVQIELPKSHYFSSSQPGPIEYFVNNDNRWIMFSMDFLDGAYAQTLVCNFDNPSVQASKQLYTFLLGVFITLSVTFGVQPLREVILSRIKSQ